MDVVGRKIAHRAHTQNLPLEFGLAAAQDRIVALAQRGADRRRLQAGGHVHRDDRHRVRARLREHVDARGDGERSDSTCVAVVPGICVARSHGVVTRDRNVEREEDGERRRPRRLAKRRELARLAEIEVEGRRGRALHAFPAPRADGDHGRARRYGERLLRSRDDDIEVPRIHLEGGGAEAADRVDDHRGRMAADRGGEGGHIVLDARRGLVVGQENARDLVSGVGAQARGQRRRIDGAAERRLEQFDREAVSRRDLREALTEHADRTREHFLARRERTRHGRLEAARARGSEDEHVARRTEDRLHAELDPLDQCGELRSAMIDHRRRHRLEDGGRAGDGAGNEQQLLRHLGPHGTTAAGVREWKFAGRRMSSHERVRLTAIATGGG